MLNISRLFNDLSLLILREKPEERDNANTAPIK